MASLKLSAAVVAIALAACREPSTGPATPEAPAFAAVAAACPTPANFIVSNEAGLLAALAAATPGQVIGVSGTITVSADLVITTPGLTLTCASAGAGLTAQPGVGDMLNALAAGVTVDRLVLDASNADDGPYVAVNAAGVRLTNDRVTCGPGSCAFFGTTPRAVVSDNQFVTSGSVTGVHMQQDIDSSRVERNTVVWTGPCCGPVFGGIRARDGVGVVIAGNVVRGPWLRSFALADLSRSLVQQNRLEGAATFGILARAGGSLLPISITDNLFSANQITGAGSAGIRLQSACRNTLVGNNLQGNAGNLGVVFDATTGANTLVGNQNIAIDNGAFDCNGDAANDPNIITGRGAVLHGVNLGAIVSDAVVNGNRLK